MIKPDCDIFNDFIKMVFNNIKAIERLSQLIAINMTFIKILNL